MTLTLRPYTAADLPIRLAGESEFDDFGPIGPLLQVPPCDLGENGHLAVDVDGTVVGDVGWFWMRHGPGPGSRCPMIGISLDPDHRGRGYGTQAQRLLVDLLFAGLTVNRVEAETDVENGAEQRSLERAGFSREGVARQSQWRHGAYHDTATYAVLRDEWASVRVRE